MAALQFQVLFFLAIVQYSTSLKAVYSGDLLSVFEPLSAAGDNSDLVYAYGGWSPDAGQLNDKIHTFNVTSGRVDIVGTIPEGRGYQGVSATDGAGNIFYFVWNVGIYGQDFGLWKISPDQEATFIQTGLDPKFGNFQVVSDNHESIYLLGGKLYDEPSPNNSIIRVFNTRTEQVTEVAVVPVALIYSSGVFYDNSLIINVAGFRGDNNSIYRFFLDTGAFDRIRILQSNMYDAHAFVVGDLAYFFGGFITIDDYTLHPYHYTVLNLITYKHKTQNITGLGDPNIPDHYVPASAVYVKKTNEIILAGGTYWTGYEDYASIYRIQL